jgi:hypothetical protein
MDRKDFFRQSLRYFLGFTSASWFLRKNSYAQVQKECTVCTPCEEKISFTKTWVQRFMTILDKHMDEKERTAMMLECGRTCFSSAYGPAKEGEKKEVDVFVAEMQKYVGKENCYREGNAVRFNYVGNPNGLKVADGYCLCPVLEDGPEKISRTYCLCSVGYVGEMFGRAIGYTPKVELLESVRTGGQGCKFLIHLHA